MSKKFSNLKIKFVRGITPILKLLDEKHNVVDELNIQKWDTDTIQVYNHIMTVSQTSNILYLFLLQEFLHERLA